VGTFSRQHVEQTRRGVAPPRGRLVHDVLRSPGQPLDRGIRAYMEPRLAHDFSRVRVHADPEAAASADAVNASAYTVGSHVVLGADQPRGDTDDARNLWAHELAHVVQQRSTTSHPGAVADGDSAAEVEAEHVATGVVQGLGIGAIRERSAGALQRQPRRAVKPVTAPLREREDDTRRIDDAYGAGSLDATQWRAQLSSAERLFSTGDREAATEAYLALYADVARLAQASLVVRSSSIINVVTGSEKTCKDAKPGLNFSPLDGIGWGPRATTAFVDDSGALKAPLSARGSLQPELAIVLSRQAFKPDKEETLGILRHEMMHAKDDAEDAAQALRSNPSDTSPADRTSRAELELRGYIEGFMTMFHLTHPAPTSSKDPAFVELLGALSTDETFPWAWAGRAARLEALSRLQKYYCNVLDTEHRKAFESWVNSDGVGATFDERGMTKESFFRDESFFRGLREVITMKCRGMKPSMKL
jgi:hypothetical protein